MEFEKRSLNFLPVCRYWYEVASRTPELWASWGNTLQDWTNWHLRYPNTPLELVLDRERGKNRDASLDAGVRNTLRDRASRDTIRLVHLRSKDGRLLNSILGTLATDRREVRDSRMESFILQNEGGTIVDASNFLARTQFQKLRHLDLTNCMISSWDDLTPQTEFLTTLVLHLSPSLSSPTTPQLLSFLASSPSLQELTLTGYSLPGDQNECYSQVSLPQLKRLKLAGENKDVSMFLDRLVHPDILDHLDISLDGPRDISSTIGPYLRDYFRRRGRPQSCLGVYASFSRGLLFHLGDGDNLRFHPPTLLSEPIVPFLVITVADQIFAQDSPEELFLGLIAHIPQEEIVYLRMYGSPMAIRSNPTTMGRIYALLPNLKVLYFKLIHLYALFPEPRPNGTVWFPSQNLRYVFLERVLTGGDWTPLTTFLYFSFRTSSAKRLDFLQITGRTNMSREVEDDIRSSVQDLRHVRLD